MDARDVQAAPKHAKAEKNNKNKTDTYFTVYPFFTRFESVIIKQGRSVNALV